jgi:hypothetical protein
VNRQICQLQSHGRERGRKWRGNDRVRCQARKGLQSVKAKAEPSWRFWGLYVHVCKLETLREAYALAGLGVKFPRGYSPGRNSSLGTTNA